MGVAFGGICHATPLEAAQLACANSYPVSGVTSSGALVVFNCSGVGAGGALTIDRYLDGAPLQSISVPAAFPACDWNDFPSNPAGLTVTDGVVLSGAIVGLWMIAWSFRVLRTVLKDNESD